MEKLGLQLSSLAQPSTITDLIGGTVPDYDVEGMALGIVGVETNADIIEFNEDICVSIMALNRSNWACETESEGMGDDDEEAT